MLIWPHGQQRCNPGDDLGGNSLDDRRAFAPRAARDLQCLGQRPLGFYRLEDRLPKAGETAVIKPPPSIELMLVVRKILPMSVPLVKRIAATGGDEVCRSNDPNRTISINGQVIAETFEKDRDGRPLPVWKGCMRLIEGEFFLLQPHPHSFDSRYFGPVLRCDILSVARPVWTWNPAD